MTDSTVDYPHNAGVWRVVWQDGATTYKTEWSIHHDIVREIYDEKRLAMPGADIKMQHGKVETVTDVRDLDFGTGDTDG